jgi:lysophospholipase L1-like esterase
MGFDRYIMKKIKDKKTIIYSIAALLLFILIFAVCFGKSFMTDISGNRNKSTDYRIVIFGDSIIGECRDDTSVTGIMEEILSEPVFNAALGGTCMSRTENDKRLAYTKDCLNMVSLSQAIYADDFRVQINARIKEGATDYFNETISEIANVDFKSVDTVFIEHGLNDYHAMTPLDNPDNLYDDCTFAGAIRSSVRNLKAVNPAVNIVLVTPTYTWYREQELTCEEYNPGGGILRDYVEKEMEVADELGIDIIDLYSNLYSRDVWDDWERYTNDGLHPNETGRRLIAEELCSYLKNIGNED